MKRFLPGIIAIILAVGFSAFTIKNHNTKKVTNEVWFKFNGTDPADLNDATKYSMDGDGSAPTICPTDVTSLYRCELLAPATGSPAQPVISSAIDERKRNTP
jgi:hypothetical protein